MKRIWASVMCAAAIAAVAGCSSQAVLPQAAAERVPDNRPPDFVLGVTVLAPTAKARIAAPGAIDAGGEDGASGEESNAAANGPAGTLLPRSLRPSRYIIEADGVLRAAVGEGSRTTIFPPQTRQLTPREMDAIWRQIRSTNLLGRGNPGRIEGPEEAVRSPGRTTALIYVGYDGERRTVRILLDRGSDDALAAERLVDRLAELAWVRDAYAGEDRMSDGEELDQSGRKKRRTEGDDGADRRGLRRR